MSAETITPTGKHAHCGRCYELAQEAWLTALDHGVPEWTIIEGDHSGRYSSPVKIDCLNGLATRKDTA